MKKILLYFAAALCLVACKKNNEAKGNYVDLGLSSGTKWKSINEFNPQDSVNGFYTFDEALDAFGKKVPTVEQWMELQNECTWTWTGNGYNVEGPSGESITLPGMGYHHGDGNVYGVGSGGYYWSSTPYATDCAYYLLFNSREVRMMDWFRRTGYSLRLVR